MSNTNHTGAKTMTPDALLALAEAVDTRNEAETATLVRELRALARTWTRKTAGLVGRGLVGTVGAVRVEGTDRFEITDSSRDGGRKTVTEYRNADLLPLLRAGLATCEGHGTVGLITVHPVARYVAIHARW